MGKEKRTLINNTHLQRHTSIKNSLLLKNALTQNGIKNIYMEGTFKKSSWNKTYYTCRKIIFFDINDAIEIMNKIIIRRTKTNYGNLNVAKEWMGILKKVQKDIEKYGYKIPDTTDENEGKANNISIVPGKVKTKKNTKSQLEKQRAFVDKWNETFFK